MTRTVERASHDVVRKAFGSRSSEVDRPSNSAQPTNAEDKDPGLPSRDSSSHGLIMKMIKKTTTKQSVAVPKTITSGGQKVICAIAVCIVASMCGIGKVLYI